LPVAGHELSHAEYEVGDYERRFRVCGPVDTGHVEATTKNGVPRIVLKKSKKPLPHKISVKAGWEQVPWIDRRPRGNTRVGLIAGDFDGVTAAWLFPVVSERYYRTISLPLRTGTPDVAGWSLFLTRADHSPRQCRAAHLPSS
jgi:hypothetical protein